MTGDPHEPAETPVPKPSLWDRLLRRGGKERPRDEDTGPYAAADPALDELVREVDRASREGPPPDY